MAKVLLGIVGAIVLVAIVLGLTVSGTYNSLVRLDQGTQAQWAQVENVYQRRADLVPNLVATVKGAANFEKETLTAGIQSPAPGGGGKIGGGGKNARGPPPTHRVQQGTERVSAPPSC